MSNLLDRIREPFQDEEYRHTYANDFLDAYIATQLRFLRQQHNWTQAKLADLAGMKQTRISVLEDVNYSSWSISTLRRLAEAFDLRLRVTFEEFGTLVNDYDNLSEKGLYRRPFKLDSMFQADTQAEYQIGNIPIPTAPKPGAIGDLLHDPALVAPPSLPLSPLPPALPEFP